MTADLTKTFAIQKRMSPGQRTYWNLVRLIRRKRRQLTNSMAHTPRPRPADLTRWRAMEATIATLEGRKAAEDAKRMAAGLMVAETGGDDAPA